MWVVVHYTACKAPVKCTSDISVNIYHRNELAVITTSTAPFSYNKQKT
jgi:hypothetical protein